MFGLVFSLINMYHPAPSNLLSILANWWILYKFWMLSNSVTSTQLRFLKTLLHIDEKPSQMALGFFRVLKISYCNSKIENPMIYSCDCFLIVWIFFVLCTHLSLCIVGTYCIPLWSFSPRTQSLLEKSGQSCVLLASSDLARFVSQLGLKIVTFSRQFSATTIWFGPKKEC